MKTKPKFPGEAPMMFSLGYKVRSTPATQLVGWNPPSWLMSQLKKRKEWSAAFAA